MHRVIWQRFYDHFQLHSARRYCFSCLLGANGFAGSINYLVVLCLYYYSPLYNCAYLCKLLMLNDARMAQ